MNDNIPVPVARMSRDITIAAKTLSAVEARYLVDAYYMMQEDRKRTRNQERALDESKEPNLILSWLAAQSETLEEQLKKALDHYTQHHPMGEWMRDVKGIGPVISAGLLAHIDITKAPTVGHIWRFAGLDPTSKWEKGQKRPWNAALKVLCWKAGQSFMKLSNDDECFYGRIYKERKVYEINRNLSGANKELAASLLPRFSKTTEAYKHLSNGVLPPRPDRRSRSALCRQAFLGGHAHGVVLADVQPAPAQALRHHPSGPCPFRVVTVVQW